MSCEITMSESCAGPGFALKRDDRLKVGLDIDEAEAVRWVKGGRARVTSGELKGADAGAATTRMIGLPPEEPSTAETVIRRSRKAA